MKEIKPVNIEIPPRLERLLDFGQEYHKFLIAEQMKESNRHIRGLQPTQSGRKQNK